MTSLSIGLLMVVWVDFGLNLVKKQSNETLTKDERMKLVYADYVYVITYVEAIMVVLHKAGSRKKLIFRKTSGVSAPRTSTSMWAVRHFSSC